MVLKKDKGCRVDRGYRIDALDAFKRLIIKKWDSLKEGFLLQSYIPSHPVNDISQYYRWENSIRSSISITVGENSARSCRTFKRI